MEENEIGYGRSRVFFTAFTQRIVLIRYIKKAPFSVLFLYCDGDMLFAMLVSN